jgi:hypothetical protein
MAKGSRLVGKKETEVCAMQESLVVLECLRKSSQDKALTRVYRQLYNPNFYTGDSETLIYALKEEKYRDLSDKQLQDIKFAVEQILVAVFDAEFSFPKIFDELKGLNSSAKYLEPLPAQALGRIKDGRFWRLYEYLGPWKIYLKRDNILVWENQYYSFIDKPRDTKEIELSGLRWQLGEITLDRSFKAKLLRPYQKDGKPVHRRDLLNLSESVIIDIYQKQERYFQRILSVLTEPAKDADLIYILRTSLLKTLACKLRTSVRDVKQRFELFDAN